MSVGTHTHTHSLYIAGKGDYTLKAVLDSDGGRGSRQGPHAEETAHQTILLLSVIAYVFVLACLWWGYPVQS